MCTISKMKANIRQNKWGELFGAEFFLGHKIEKNCFLGFHEQIQWRRRLETVWKKQTKPTQTLNKNVVRTAKWRKASWLAKGCAVRCELIASDGGGVENASAQARHQRPRPSTGVNIQRGVSKGYENTSMNTGLASQPHCQLLLAPRRRNKPTLGQNGRHLGGVGENQRVNMKLLWADGKTRLMALGEGRHRRSQW